MYDICLKSGTGSYYDELGCDCLIAKVPNNNIPKVGDIIEICKNGYEEYLVKEIKRSIHLEPFKEYIRVYVVKII